MPVSTEKHDLVPVARADADPCRARRPAEEPQARRHRIRPRPEARSGRHPSDPSASSSRRPLRENVRTTPGAGASHATPTLHTGVIGPRRTVPWSPLLDDAAVAPAATVRRDDERGRARATIACLHHAPLPSSSGRSLPPLGTSHALALADRDRCADEREVSERLGKFPSCRPATGSYSSARSPTSLRRSSSRSKSSRASSCLPWSASTSASQNEQGRKTPSPAGSPSTCPSLRET